MKKVGDYYINQHSCFLLQYHFVMVTKYRHKIISGELKDFLLQYTNEYFDKQGLHILAVNTDEDYLHIVFEAYPNLNLAHFVNAYKSASSRQVKVKFNKLLSKYYWKQYFWSQSYFISTVSEKSTELVQQYVNNQGIK